MSSLITTFHQLFPVIRENLHDLPSQYYNFCSRFATTFIAKFIANLYRCKPLSHGGAEQLLLDSHTLKKTLLELPEYQATSGNKVPASYSGAVVAGMTKAEMILKIVLVSSSPPEMFVENYFKLIHEKDISEFQKVLDMKNIKKGEAAILSEIFRKKCLQLGSSGTLGDLYHNSSTGNASTTNDAEGGDGAELDSSRIKKLEKLIMKRL